MKQALLLLMLISFAFITKGQAPAMPQVLQMTPTAYSFHRYGDYPVSHYTGVPEINIPIHTIKEGDLELPISLSYHASGIKIYDHSGVVGLGWTLNAGGRVTRSIVGLDDNEHGLPLFGEFSKHSDIYNDPNSPPKHREESLNGIFRYIPDRTHTEYDIYSYGINGYHGKFILKKEKEAGAWKPLEPVLFPYRPIKIMQHQYPMEIIDEKGVLHRFGSSTENNITRYGDEFSAINNKLSSESNLIMDMVSAIDSSNIIKFSYDYSSRNFLRQYYIKQEKRELGDALVFDDQLYDTGPCNGTHDFDKCFNESYLSYNIPHSHMDVKYVTPIEANSIYSFNTTPVSEISFRSGKVIFLYNTQTWMLSEIKIFDYRNTHIKSVKLITSTFPGSLSENQPQWGPTHRYRLDAVQFYDAKDNFVNEYTFDYLKDAFGFNIMPDWDTDAIDYWGYYTGRHTNLSPGYGSGFRYVMPQWTNRYDTTIKPYEFDYRFDFQFAGITHLNGPTDRSADGNFMQLHTLYKINYPTGGSTEFEYEANRGQLSLPAVESIQYGEPTPYYHTSSDYANLDTNGTWTTGGLRVKRIINKDENGIITRTKIFGYGEFQQVGTQLVQSGYGVMEVEPRPEHYVSTQVGVYYYLKVVNDIPMGQVYVAEQFRSRYISSEPNIDLAPHGSPVVYPFVTETEYNGSEIDFNSQPVRKTEYTYDFIPNTYQHYNTNKDYNYNSDFKPNNFQPFISHIKGWNNGQLRSMIIKDKDGNELLREEKEYEEIIREQVWALHASRYVFFLQRPFSPEGTEPGTTREYLWVYNDATNDYNRSAFNYGEYFIVSGEKRLKSEAVTRDGITLTTNYVYGNPTHAQVTQVTSTGSVGEVLKTEIKYPHEFMNGSTTSPNIYDQMVARNIITPVIEKQDYVGASTTPVQATKTHYALWNGTFFAPELVETLTGAGQSYEPRLRYQGYDTKGNILQVAREGDKPVSYVWAYNQTLPVAEAVNANSNEIFYDGFEEQTGWDANMGYNTRSRTGRIGGQIVNSSTSEKVSHSSKWLSISLTAPKKFRYSGWVYSTGPSAEIYLFMKKTGESTYFTYVHAVQTSVKDKWVYLEGEYLVPHNITSLGIRLDNNGMGIVHFDDIRVYPADAQMSTYTYDPLVGMTSQTDDNGRATFYAYDDSGRLRQVRDNERNLVQAHDYHYRGQDFDYGTFTPTFILQSNSNGGYSFSASGGETYHWDFGDGTSTDKASGIHTYPMGNTYTVTAKVTHPYHGTRTFSKTIRTAKIEWETDSYENGALMKTLACDGVTITPDNNSTIMYAMVQGLDLSQCTAYWIESYCENLDTSTWEDCQPDLVWPTYYPASPDLQSNSYEYVVPHSPGLRGIFQLVIIDQENNEHYSAKVEAGTLFAPNCPQ